jgi:hypothetical protein
MKRLSSGILLALSRRPRLSGTGGEDPSLCWYEWGSVKISICGVARPEAMTTMILLVYAD